MLLPEFGGFQMTYLLGLCNITTAAANTIIALLLVSFIAINSVFIVTYIHSRIPVESFIKQTKECSKCMHSYTIISVL